MKVVNEPIVFLGDWMFLAPNHLVEAQPMFYPEDARNFTLSELKEIVKEMEKMNGSI
jgi:hypothetical protein